MAKAKPHPVRTVRTAISDRGREEYWERPSARGPGAAGVAVWRRKPGSRRLRFGVLIVGRRTCLLDVSVRFKIQRRPRVRLLGIHGRSRMFRVVEFTEQIIGRLRADRRFRSRSESRPFFDLSLYPRLISRQGLRLWDLGQILNPRRVRAPTGKEGPRRRRLLLVPANSWRRSSRERQALEPGVTCGSVCLLTSLVHAALGLQQHQESDADHGRYRRELPGQAFMGILSRSFE